VVKLDITAELSDVARHVIWGLKDEVSPPVQKNCTKFTIGAPVNETTVKY